MTASVPLELTCHSHVESANRNVCAVMEWWSKVRVSN